jgi:conjugative transfer signal peptidase TraF
MTRPSRRLLAVAAVGLALIGVSAAHRFAPVLVWNASASVPIGLYLISPRGADLRVGDLVAAAPTEDLEAWLVAGGYLGRDTPLLKEVAALGGAEVCRDGLQITIDGRPAAMALAVDRLDRPLPAWSGCRVLAAGEVFLLNPNAAASLDGRYFGPLPRATILGRARPLWTRGG